MSLSQAERLLQELGITEPKEIDLDAIAYYVNAQVRYRPLDGCEARIVGIGERAIITVNEQSIPRRKRFSVAHELGHWHNHRGQCLVCRVEDDNGNSSLAPERIANSYAADLLMPMYIFRPIARQHGKLNFKMIAALAETFNVSKTAMAIRLIRDDFQPALLVWHRPDGRKGFIRAPSVPARWFPQQSLHADSFAFDILFGGAPEDTFPRKIGADAWFDCYDAPKFEVQEQSIRISAREILTLVLLTDAEMMEERDALPSKRGR